MEPTRFAEALRFLVVMNTHVRARTHTPALPGLPMEPTRFPEPLRSFVTYIAEVGILRVCVYERGVGAGERGARDLVIG